MGVVYKLQCPDCGQQYRLKVENGEGLPDFCPKCGSYVGGDPDFVPSKVTIRSALGKSGDQTYRMIEQSSEVRAQMAGDPSLKVTNIKDNLREGDVAAIPVKNAVTEYQQAAQEAFGAQQWAAMPTAKLIDAKNGRDRTTGEPVLSAITDTAPRSQVPTVRGMKPSWGNA